MDNIEYNIFTADISGTNSTFAIINIKNLKIIYKEKHLTKKIKDISILINNFLDKSKIKNITNAVFALAGPVNKSDRVKITNGNIIIDKKKILKKTKLKNILFINDFEAVGFAINKLNLKDKIIINKGKRIKNDTKAIIGAGTGLGKTILYFDKKNKYYIPIRSEGGHCDFAIKDKKEFEIYKFIKAKQKNKTFLRQQDIVSGKGIESLYQYYKIKNFKNNKNIPNKLTASEISNTIKTNKCSKITLDNFIKFYARCAKNIALNSYCVSGLYLAGGIFSKNKELFNKNFINEFIKHEEYSQILKNIPIIGIINYDIGLKGAAFAFKNKNA
ncbi:MAG: glucokinase [Nanoarchaeota archaeon]